MSVQRMDHVGVVVDDLAAATAFFVALGLEAESEMSLGGEVVDRIIGLHGVQTDVVFLRTPDGHGALELTAFRSPSYDGDHGPEPAHAPGIRHLTFAVDDLDATLQRVQPLGAELIGEVVAYGNSYRLCYVRGPAAVIVELAEKIG
jgi:catechol 2,3-dioxygenase-like lactoylglutathione lyase family enzyme